MIKWNPELDSFVAGWREQKLSYTDIAYRLSRRLGYHVDRNAIIGRVHREMPALREMRAPGKPRPPYGNSPAIIAYNQEHPTATARQISEALGIGYDAVRSAIQRFKLPVGKIKVKGKTRQLVKDYLAQNPAARQKEIAEAIGVSVCYVEEIGRLEGMPFSRRTSNVVQFPRSDRKRTVFEQVPKPQLRVIVNEKMMIADYLAKHGVRKFGDKDTCDYFAIQAWMRERGYTLVHHKNNYRLSNGRGRPKSWRNWRDCVAFVDDLRAKEGLPRVLPGTLRTLA